MTTFKRLGWLGLAAVAGFSVSLAAAPISAQAAEPLKFKVLVKVADFPIVDVDRDLEFYLRNPAKFKGQAKPNATPAQLQEVLDRLMVEIMIYEENKVVGTVEISTGESLALLKNIKAAFGSHWRELLSAFDTDENSIKERLQHRAVVDKVIQKKIEAVMKLPTSNKENSQKAAQRAVDDWLKQLRGRYRVQVFE